VVISKYVKLGATIVISLLAVDFVVFKLFVTNNVEQYEKMSQQYAEKAALFQKNAQGHAETYMQDQIQMQNKQRQASIERAMYQPVTNNANSYNSSRAINSQQRYYENKKKEEQRSLKREKAYKEQVIRERQRKKERENLSSLRAKNDETCAFWRKTYRQQATSANQKNRNSACERAAND
jgi:hypothetical protein